MNCKEARDAQKEADWIQVPRERERTKTVATPSHPMNRRRSERVMLRVRITVLAEDTERNRHQVEALTHVVNAHGGLMKMPMELHVGQSILLGNPQNNARQGCRVVRVECITEGDFAVAFEFDKPNPKFWPVVFPPEDWQAATA